MASTVTPSEFKVFIKEDHVINGIRTINENLYRIPNVTNYDRRIVTVPADTNVDLINTNGPVPGPALFPSYSIAYGRITNMDDTNRLAVTFTSSNGESETGEIGKDLSGSYTSGGTGGTAGTYSNLPTSTDGSGSGMTLQVITDETLKSDPLVTLTPLATTLAAIGTYTVGLVSTNGTGTGASGSVTVTAGAGNDASIPTYTQLEFVASGSGYAVGEVLRIPEGALSNGNLIKGNTLTNVTVPTVDNNVTVNNIPIVTSTGQGATVNVNSSGNVINTVIVNAVGKEFQANQEFTITEATIQTGGNGYAVGDTLTVAKANIGNSTNDLVYTLDTNDFSLTGTKSYWTMECLPTSSIMFSSPNCSGSKFNGIFEQDIEFISVYALTGSVDVEYVLVNAPVATN